MTTGEFAKAVEDMRELQKEWKKAHSYAYGDDKLTTNMREAEKVVDRAISARIRRIKAEAAQAQGDLFGQ